MPLLLCIAVLSVVPGQATDLANGQYRDAWLRHPVLGEASFDRFERAPGNPIYRGSPPYDWPVNGFLFEDPKSANWYVYVGEYCEGYAMNGDIPSRCVGLRSSNRGATWELLGPVLDYEGHLFAGETSPLYNAPDVSVVYADGRYHMCYDWATRSTTWENAANPGAVANSGVGYAWADQPEGPFHPTEAPLATTRDQTPLLGKYRRLYASTMIRRAGDWLVLTLTDSGPYFGWALLGMTAPNPEGPYSTPQLLLHPESDAYHPPLLEFFPAFVHEGFIYSPTTSVALNRNYQALFRVPIEDAMKPGAWELHARGSVWHAESHENEAYGIWGQTFSGFVDGNSDLQVMFPSRDTQGLGTINLAHRPWARPYRDQGFVVSGHQGPSLALAEWSGALSELDVEGSFGGTVSLVWDHRGPLGANEPRSNATIHPLVRTQYAALRFTKGDWALESFDAAGSRTEQGAGVLAALPHRVRISWSEGSSAKLDINDETLWEGTLAPGLAFVGILTEKNSHAVVQHYRVAGERNARSTFYLYTDALLGAAQNLADWKVTESSDFRYGVGAVSTGSSAMAKWNVEGNTIRVWSPTGPELGVVHLTVDGEPAGEFDCRTDTPRESRPVMSVSNLTSGPHAVILRAEGGGIAVDALEVMR